MHLPPVEVVDSPGCHPLSDPLTDQEEPEKVVKTHSQFEFTFLGQALRKLILGVLTNKNIF